MAEQASLSLTWSETPEDTFFHGVAHFLFKVYETKESYFSHGNFCSHNGSGSHMRSKANTLYVHFRYTSVFSYQVWFAAKFSHVKKPILHGNMHLLHTHSASSIFYSISPCVSRICHQWRSYGVIDDLW